MLRPIEVDSVEAKWQRGRKRGGSREKRGQKGEEAEERVGREGRWRVMYHWPRTRFRVACPPHGVGEIDIAAMDGPCLPAGNRGACRPRDTEHGTEREPPLHGRSNRPYYHQQITT